MPGRCPKCGSGDLVGYQGVWECMRCGYSFKEEGVIPHEPTKPPYSGSRGGRPRLYLTAALLLIVGLILGGVIHALILSPRAPSATVTVTQTLAGSVSLEEYNALRERYNLLLADYNLLNESYQNAMLQLEAIRNSLNQLEAERRGLEEQVASLRELCANPDLVCEDLERRYAVLAELDKKYARRVGLTLEGLPRLLNETPPYIIDGGRDPRSPPQEKAKWVFDWIVTNMEYYRDDVHYKIVGESVEYRDDFYLFPGETLTRGGGDCEDLALLAYSMLRPLLNNEAGERLYLIGLSGPTTSHVAVLYESPSGYMIIDPSGSYITDGYAATRIRLANGSSVLVPLITLTPQVKAILGDPEYHSPGDWREGADIGPRDLGRCIELWTRFWSVMKGEEVRVSFIADESVSRSFESNDEFLLWMAQR